MLEKIQIVVILFLIPFGILFWYASTNDIPMKDIFAPKSRVMHIDDILIRVDIANTDAERIKGLSGLDKIKETNGLLFVFPDVAYHGIWMKDMKFPIDVIWIDENLKIVAVNRSIHPNTYPKTFRPPVPVKYIVETEANYVDFMGIQIGDEVILPLNYLED